MCWKLGSPAWERLCAYCVHTFPCIFDDNLVLLYSNCAVPLDPVLNLEVFRTPNNKSLLAQWRKLETSLPDGRVAFYQVEYRNKGKDISMTAQIASTFDFFSILDVENASAYEVQSSVTVY